MNGYIHHNIRGGIIYPFPTSIGCTVEVWEWISNFISHFTRHVIIYQYWDETLSVLVKGVPVFFDTQLHRPSITPRENLLLDQCNFKYRPDPKVSDRYVIDVDQGKQKDVMNGMFMCGSIFVYTVMIPFTVTVSGYWSLILRVMVSNLQSLFISSNRFSHYWIEVTDK